MKLADLVKTGSQAGATDIHLQVGSPPMFRFLGQMRPANVPPLDEPTILDLVAQLLPEDLVPKVSTQPVVEYVKTISDVRVRASVFHQRGTVSVVLRLFVTRDLSLEALHLPTELAEILKVPRGVILIGGPGSSGKTTTVAALVHHLNQNYPRKIVTIEELTEFEHTAAKSLVAQIQLGRDARTRAEALRDVTRQDPDVIVISELVTYEDIQLALSAADTGKLIISTILSGDVIQTLQRIHALIPPVERELMMPQLSYNFLAICCQRLMWGKDRKTLYPATELLRRSPGTMRTIAEARFMPLNQLMEQEHGMHRFDTSIANACKAGYITEAEGKRCATSPEAFEMKMRGFGATAKA